MANKKTGGFINRLLVGKEKSEGYARSTLPSNRWELFWDIFKGRFGKLFILNILTLLFFLPLIFLIVYRTGLLATYGSLYPFAQGFGVGYLAPVSLTGYSENIIFSVNTLTLLFLPIVSMIAAIGISGLAYVIRNMVWTEGVFIANDFWRGIKQNAKQMCLVALLYSVVFYVFTLAISFTNQAIALGTLPGLFTAVKIIAIILLSFCTLITLHMITLCVTYELPMKHLIKNGMVLSIGMIFSNIVMVLAAAIPFLILLLDNFVLLFGILFILIFGFSFAMLVWTVYSQWIYDGYINDKVKGAKKNRGIYEKVKKDDTTLKQYKTQQQLMPTSKLSSMPIKPITDEELKLEELPTSFRRSDIEKLNESRKKLYEDNENYIREHSGEEQFVKAVEEKAILDSEAEKRIAKAKKELERNNKKKKK